MSQHLKIKLLEISKYENFGNLFLLANEHIHAFGSLRKHLEVLFSPEP